MPKLDKRLREIVDNVQGNVLADIGCDHGKVGVSALLEGRVSKVIASDISALSLKKAHNLAKSYDLSQLETRCCNGFDAFQDNEADIAVVAGMGGKEIIKIMSNSPRGIEKYILLAHSDCELLREYLTNNNFGLTKDYVLHCKKHFYHLMVVEMGSSSLTPTQLLLGNSKNNSQDFLAYLNYVDKKWNDLLLKQTNEEKRQEYINKIQLVRNKLEEIKNA